MKSINLIFLTILLLNGIVAVSQKVLYKENNSFGLTVNSGAGNFANSFSWSHYHGIGKAKRFNAGYGLRLTNFFGSDQEYITAPAKYTSGKNSIVALFTENIEANLDTVSFPKSQTNFFNAGIYLKYLLPFCKNKFEVGVNIDALGFTFGGSQNAIYKNNTVSAKPTTFNLLLVSDSDRGSLNSEWYVGFWVTKRLTVKAGYEFLFTEYTTDDKIQQLPNSSETNDRFRLKASMIMLGIEFSPFRR